jgi:inward rectifier potassium channel
MDFFHELISMSWKKFVLLVVSAYFVTNLIFALLYFFLGTENFGNLRHTTSGRDFLELFFFSAQTLTTVGYGYLYPKSPSAGSIAAIESMFGLLGFALATGVLFARFSRPQARVRFSKHCLISPYEGMTGFMFRVANTTQNELIEVEAKVILVKNNIETRQREFLPLPLEIDKISFMALSWTIVHPIDPHSPMFKMSREDLIRSDAEFLILLKAMNDTYSQTVYARSSYKGQELVEGAKFKPLERTQRGGKITINLRKLDEFEKAAPAAN